MTVILGFLYYSGRVFDFNSSDDMTLCILIIPLKFSALAENLISIEYLKTNQVIRHKCFPDFAGEGWAQTHSYEGSLSLGRGSGYSC